MRRILFLTISLLVAMPALAQEDNGALADKLNRLERDVNFLQKQVYRSSSSSSNDDGEITTAAPANSGAIEVRLTQMDEQLRQIRGQLEQAQFQTKQVATELKKLSDDVDYRLRALEQKQAAVDAAAVAAPSAVPPAATQVATPPAEPAAPAAYTPDPKDKTALTGKDFPTSNAHYSYALKLLNEKKYSEAATSFDAFVKKFPTDPLISNAFYWLGESYYARNDFTRAADSFRKGFEANADGQKAPDNLFKLAMSLAQVKRTNEACIVLSQVVSKYGEGSPRTAQRATEERLTLQCK